MQANRRANSASSDTQNITNTNDEIIYGAYTNAVIGVENTDNAAIAAENVDNAAIDAENTDNAAINADNTSNAATDGVKSDDATMNDNETDNATTGNDNTNNTTTGKTSTVHVPLPPCYGGKTKYPSKIKTSTKHTPTIAESSIGDPPPNEITTVKASGHTFDPTDVHIYEFFIQGAPNLFDLEGIEEDQLLEIQQNIQDKLKQRDEERERNITKRMKQYEEKYDFINKALLESVAHITEMTKTDHQ